MVEDEQDGPDLETLQAQIDMSMAFTHNIVSGWMKSSKSKLPASSSRNEDKELDEYMRRPARLGVGASVSETTGVLSRETAKLRGKLTGKGRKRGREDEEDAAAPSAGAGVGAGAGATVESEDEDDSRARAITKKARVDPFAPKADKKKKKKKAKEGDAVAAPAGGKTRAAPSASPVAGQVGVGAREELSVAFATGGTPPEKDAAQTSSPRKKKKKRKGAEDGSPHGTSITAPQDPTAGSPSVASKLAPTESHASPNPPETLAEGTKRVHGVSSSSSRPAQSSTAHASVTSPIVVSAARHNPLAVPLLNLSGPPPDTEQGQSKSPKKKRKRKKRKKKTVAQHEPGAAADGDGDGSEDD